MLHTGTIDGNVITNEELRIEFFKLQTWWTKTCDAMNYGMFKEVFFGEEQYAIEWCISLTEEIVEDELAFRQGKEPTSSIQITRKWVWDRFENLEKGLMSNGISRKNNY